MGHPFAAERNSGKVKPHFDLFDLKSSMADLGEELLLSEKGLLFFQGLTWIQECFISQVYFQQMF